MNRRRLASAIAGFRPPESARLMAHFEPEKDNLGRPNQGISAADTGLTLCHVEGFEMTLWRKLSALTLIVLHSMPTLLATEPATLLQTTDVILQNGVMQGTMLDRSAQPVAGVKVRLFHRETQIAETISNDRGEFSISGLRTGSHILGTAGSLSNIRFWSTDAAPPTAANKAMIVCGQQIVRFQDEDCGDDCGEGLLSGSKLAKPAMLLAIAGGVVGIVAIVEHNEDHHPVSP